MNFGSPTIHVANAALPDCDEEEHREPNDCGPSNELLIASPLARTQLDELSSANASVDRSILAVLAHGPQGQHQPRDCGCDRDNARDQTQHIAGTVVCVFENVNSQVVVRCGSSRHLQTLTATTGLSSSTLDLAPHGVSRGTSAIMKVVPPVCPGCGAPLAITHRQREVTCSYCTLTSVIERERPPSNPEEYKVQTVYVPKANPALSGIIYVLTGVGTLIGGGATYTYFSAHSNRTPSAPMMIRSPKDGNVETPALLFLDRPMLADANGDGHADVIGKCSMEGLLDQQFVAAFDGKTGGKLWVTEPLTKVQQSLHSLRAIVGDKGIVIDELGKVQTYHLASGKPAWSSNASDGAGAICEREGQLVAKSRDDKLSVFTLASGEKQSLPSGTDCLNVFSSINDQAPDYGIVAETGLKSVYLVNGPELDGFSPSHTLIPTEGNVAFSYGTQTEGSGAAMVAAVANKRAVWKSIVPGVEPLRTVVNASTQKATYVPGRLALPYNMKDTAEGVRMAAFDTANGQRLWDVQVHELDYDLLGLSSCPDTVYLSTGKRLYALDWANGSQRFRIGPDY